MFTRSTFKFYLHTNTQSHTYLCAYLHTQTYTLKQARELLREISWHRSGEACRSLSWFSEPIGRVLDLGCILRPHHSTITPPSPAAEQSTAPSLHPLLNVRLHTHTHRSQTYISVRHHGQFCAKPCAPGVRAVRSQRHSEQSVRIAQTSRIPCSDTHTGQTHLHTHTHA